MYMIVVGGLKAYGVLYAEMLAVHQAGSGNTAWIGATSLLLMFGCGRLTKSLYGKYKCRVLYYLRLTLIV